MKRPSHLAVRVEYVFVIDERPGRREEHRAVTAREFDEDEARGIYQRLCQHFQDQPSSPAEDAGDSTSFEPSKWCSAGYPRS